MFGLVNGTNLTFLVTSSQLNSYYLILHFYFLGGDIQTQMQSHFYVFFPYFMFIEVFQIKGGPDIFRSKLLGCGK